ncbi:HD domain-containing phosphohydrolase [Sporolactobacillus spathodeae]|uniref:Nucleotidyltransferase with HDIG domain n=1 Tax=Sporolactobacillus spathodeae TaxID=1465502 RepID=A0ABS2Q7Y8_9BACL|nr:HD domain-containing phosphohydrolase [Sporolactobacillus spathodeae]MBM7657279.1 putative nucleotidyltransferase with HDIG domain [Sporolactobacillus spathodeae]
MTMSVKVKQLAEGYLLGQDVYINSKIRYHSGTYITRQMAEDIASQGICNIKVLSDKIPSFNFSDKHKISKHDVHLLTERFQNDIAPLADELRYGHILHSETSYKWLHQLYLQLFSNPTIRLLMDSLKQWDPICYTHSIDVFILCSLFVYQLDEELPKDFVIGALLHDIGKLFTPRAILLKTGKLTEREYQQITQHAADGAALLKQFKFSEETCRIALSHHERMNGQGYPNQQIIEKNDCALKLIMIADVYSALTLNRSYRKPMHATKALEIILRDAVSRQLFDLATCYQFIQFIRIYPPASKVILSNGQKGSIIENPKGSDILPRIKLEDSQTIVQLPKDLSITIEKVTGWAINQLHLQAKQLWTEYIQCLIDGNSLNALQCLEKLSDSKRVENVFIDIFARALSEIEAGKAQKRWTTADELIARETTVTLLDWRMLRFATELKVHMGRIIIANLSRPKDLVIYKMINSLLTINGWKSYFLAEQVAEKELLDMIAQKDCAYLCLSLTEREQLPIIEHLLHSLTVRYPNLTVFIHGAYADLLHPDPDLDVHMSATIDQFVAHMSSCF